MNKYKKGRPSEAKLENERLAKEMKRIKVTKIVLYEKILSDILK